MGNRPSDERDSKLLVMYDFLVSRAFVFGCYCYVGYQAVLMVKGKARCIMDRRAGTCCLLMDMKWSNDRWE